MKRYVRLLLSVILIVYSTLIGCAGEFYVEDYSNDSYVETDYENSLEEASQINANETDDPEAIIDEDTQQDVQQDAEQDKDILSDADADNKSGTDETYDINDDSEVTVADDDTVYESEENIADTGEESDDAARYIEEDGSYTSKEDVALYLHTYSCLPDNFITKNEAKDRGWNSKEGNLDEVCPGMSIGGDRFGNYEGILPDKKGRKYFECDIDYTGGRRNAKRVVYSSDGLIYYTEDHYETFEQLY